MNGALSAGLGVKEQTGEEGNCKGVGRRSSRSVCVASIGLGGCVTLTDSSAPWWPFWFCPRGGNERQGVKKN